MLKKQVKKRLKPDSPVRVSMTLRKWQVDALGGREKAREYIRRYLDAISVPVDFQ
jgi:hypothetical protein